ncbi:glutathione S-transferase family protein [Seohaeicola saemankumensis]|nr:glutathione S-transferase family protein [Seohaeicola saemankumensis]MCA0870040.1 glutathione S-transferase family protein [Seohaeicola saemankumensis]
MTAPYRLHYAPDNASLIVRLALEEMRLPYATTLVDRTRAEQRGAAYRALNPHGLIPVLETPQGPLFETGAILLWLADTHGAMAPTRDHPDRGGFLKWLFFTANTVQTELRILCYPDQYTGPEPAQSALCARLETRLRTHLGQLDAVAAQNPAWLDPAAPSVLCYHLACLMRWMALYPRNRDRSWYRLADTPHLLALLTALEQRPAVRAAQTVEGLGPTPFTRPSHANPPEGSAT